MLNIPVRAAAEGMPSITRRSMLKSLGATALGAGGIVATTQAVGAASMAIAPEQRTSGLVDLIDAHKAAYAAFMAALDATLDDWDGEDAEDARSVASDAEAEALCAILEYRPVSQADAIAKVSYLGPLNKRGQLDQQFHFDHLLASLLPEGEWLPREWWGWHTEYEVSA